MSRFLRQLSFTLIFIVYAFIFYLLFYYAFAFFKPEMLSIPSQLSSDYIAGVTLIFSMIVILAYIGASYALLGRLLSSSKPSPQKRPLKRPQLQAENQNTKIEDNAKAAQGKAHSLEAGILPPRKPLLPKQDIEEKENKQSLKQETKIEKKPLPS